jgi:large subunit ribosomal protein L10
LEHNDGNQYHRCPAGGFSTQEERAMPRPEKVKVVDAAKKYFQDSKITIIADYRGLNVAQMSELRNKLRNGQTECRIIKNTFVKIACKQNNIPYNEKMLKGPSVFVFSKGDPVFPAKILSQFAKQNELLKIKGGYLDNKELSAADIMQLSKLPSREQLIAKLAMTLNSPIQ